MARAAIGWRSTRGGRGLAAFGATLTLALAVAGCSCEEEMPATDGGTDSGGPMVDSGERQLCGDLMVTGSEQCDDGNLEPDDGCSEDCLLECGDGEVTGDEACDTAIADGDPGACPSACDDGDACTTDVLTGSDCTAACVFGDVTEAADDDGCCPLGHDATTDNDCTSVCGNGVLEGGESCDTGIAAAMPGACPTACDDGVDCTTDTLENDGTCQAACTSAPITAPANGDNCCPVGADPSTDDDCDATCGDGVVSGSESCDTAIGAGMAGACPTSCDDGVACTLDQLSNAGTCVAMCSSTAILTPIDDDGCCPPGETIATDNDCTGTCGDGVVTGGESCDTAIASGMPGACPSACDDGMPCTMDVLAGGGTCSATCSFPPITAPADGDGCCPVGETIGTDNDCPAACGDGVITAPETCDTAIAGSCPTACDDGDDCTVDMLNNAGTCRAACAATPVAEGPADSCCPPGATIATDPDCTGSCGDGAITPPETCDDGNVVAGDGCSPTCTDEPIGFRFTSLTLQDPHVFAEVNIIFTFCLDVTSGLGGMGVNDQLANAITMDGDGDGDFDLSIVESFLPLDRSAGSSVMTDLTFPDCTEPMASTVCTLPAGSVHTPATAMNLGAGMVCLEPVSGTDSWPGINAPTAPGGGTCYVASAGTVTFDLGGIPITLQDARIAGVWSGANDIINGLIRGFMSEAVADSTIVPPGTTGINTIDGHPVSELLRGGTNNCEEPAPMMGDRDTLAGSTTQGWYFYLNFTAERVTYIEQ